MIAQLRAFFAALRFFTRLPVPAWAGHSEQHLEQAARYFPLVGWLIGAIGAAATAAAAQALPVSLAVLAGMAATLLATGAFHEDGLADAADGFGGGRDKAHILQIMKDPHLGSFGAIALGLMLLAKFNALVQIDARLGLRSLALALIAGHALSRLGAVALLCTLDYVREDQTAKSRPVARRLGAGEMGVALLFGLSPCLLLGGVQAIRVVALAAGATLAWGAYCLRRIGGYTGDCLGAAQQLAELACYLALLCASS